MFHVIRLCCFSGLTWAVRVSNDEIDQLNVGDGPAIHWHDSAGCREVKEFAPEPAVLKINLDLSKVLLPQWLHVLDCVLDMRKAAELGTRKTRLLRLKVVDASWQGSGRDWRH